MPTETNTGDTVPSTGALWAMLLCTLFPTVGLFALGPATPSIAAAFPDNPDAVLLAQLIGGVAGFAFALVSPVVGIAIERWGHRNVYLVSVAGFGLAGAMPALLGDLWTILATRALLGVTIAGAMIAGVTGLSLLPAAIRPRMFGRNALVASLAAIAMFPLVGALTELGWRWPFLIHLFAFAILPFAFGIPRHVRAAPTASEAKGSGLGISPVMLLVAGFTGFTMYIGPMFSPFYLHSIGVTDPKLVALPLSCMSIASLLVTSQYGRLHGRMGVYALFVFLFALMGIGLLLGGIAPALAMFVAAMFLLSCGQSLFTPNLNAYIAETSAVPARAISWAMAAMFAVQVAFPFIAQAITRSVGPSAVFLLLGVASILVAAAFAAAAIRSGRRGPAVHPATATARAGGLD